MLSTINDYLAQPPHIQRKQGGVQICDQQDVGLKSIPVVSVVTVVRNSAALLETTIRSVIELHDVNIEHIIIDGASTDNTLETIGRYNDKIAFWLSEPDKGIADAWNKGIAHSRGQVITILNAGDYLAIDSVQKVIEDIDISQAMITYGNTVMVDDRGQSLSKVNGRFNPKNLAMGMGFMHPACFATRKAYEQVGLFNTRYRFAMDCDWLLRCYRQGITFKRLDNVCYMIEGGASAQANYAAYGEYLQAMRDNGFSDLQVRAAIAQYGVYLFIRSLGGKLLKLRDAAQKR